MSKLCTTTSKLLWLCAIFYVIVCVRGSVKTGLAVGQCDQSEDELVFSGITRAEQILNANRTSYANVKYLTITQSIITFSEDVTRHFPKVTRVAMNDTVVNCTNDTLWLLAWRDKVSDPDNVLCIRPSQVSQQQAFKILALIQYSNAHCPEKCQCTLDHVPKDRHNFNSPNNKDLIPAHVAVNCSNLGLVELPRVLPENVTTILLDVSNNKIKDVSELATNALYRKVRKINLANNHIKSVSKLEDTEWMENVKMLNLQGNRLREMPIDGMNRSRNHMDSMGYRIFLANNPWRCDCFTVTNFQKFIAQTHGLVKDAKDVTCGPDEGENAGLQIREIEPHTVCIPDDELMQMIMFFDALNVVLTVAIVVTISKLLYDWHVYSKTGKLPWLATKLP